MSLDKTGCSKFCSQIRQEGRTYSIFTAQVPVEKLLEELQRRFQVEKWEQNVNRNGRLSDLPGAGIIKFKNNPWVTVYWSIDRYLNVKSDCGYISTKFNTGVINIWEIDTNGSVEWLVYENGEEREGAERMSDNEIYFRSSLRKNQKFPKKDAGEKLDASIQELLSKQSVYIPALDFDLSHPDIERVDMLTLPSKPLGMLDFQKCVYEGHPEYAIFAVKGNIDEVNQVLNKYQADAEFRKDIQSNELIWNIISENDQYWMPIIQPQNNNWTVVYWNRGDWKNLSKMCGEISSKMQTKVMELSEEDTSAAVGYTLFADGKKIESMEWCPGEEMTFESEIREEPELDNFDDDESDVVNGFINDIFIEEGIYIPGWSMKVSDSWLGRVDLMRRF
ncbi:MAG: hypothetical protein AAF378_06660 [Cyanobacteria bacterium P01_A01_bin.84]